MKLKLGLTFILSFWWLTSHSVVSVLADGSHPLRNALVENYDETGRKLPPGVPKYVDTNGMLLSIDRHFTTPEYQREALRLMIQEANLVAKELGISDQLPITQSDLAEYHVSPFGFAYGNKMIGFVQTANYVYYVSCDNRFNHLDIANYDKTCFKFQDQGSLPITKLDTNIVFCLATNWLNKLSMDVAGLNRDCKAHIALSPFWNGLAHLGEMPQKRFVPIYYVWWTSPENDQEGHGSVASVELYAPTKKLLQLSVSNSKYILRTPLIFTNLDSLLPGTAPVINLPPPQPGPQMHPG